MIPKSSQEKLALKQAKKSYKNAQKKLFKGEDFDDLLMHPKEKILKKEKITSGIMDGEEPLDDNYPVYAGYCYVIDDEQGKVIFSHVNTNIKGFKQALRAQGYKANIVFNCKMAARNLF
jgi:hypothetical protein